MNTLSTLLYDLRSKPHAILPQYANALESKIEQYLAGELTMPEQDDNKEENNSVLTIGSVAVIDINGVICKRLGLPKDWLKVFGLVDLDNVDAQLKAIANDDTITGVVLNITSPGGFLSGVQSTSALIDKISQTKEVVFYSDVLNASAAYWLSSQANMIVTSRDAECGSIGVYTTIQDCSKAYEDAGVKVHLIKAGKYKAIGEPSQPLSDEAKAFLQNEINGTWQLFKDAVNSKRKISDDDMQGQTFSGESLIEKQLIDGFADDIDEVISAMNNK